jgi:apolipoprotein N-acyltransferase
LILSKKYYIKLIHFSLPAVLVIVVSYSIGYYLFKKWETYPVTSHKKVIMIQPNAPLEFRDGRSVNKVLDELMIHIEELAIKGGEGLAPDLIVLPESGVPFYSAQ